MELLCPRWEWKIQRLAFSVYFPEEQVSRIGFSSGYYGDLIEDSMTCTYENGSCILCGAQDPNVTGLFDISVKLHSHNFLFFRLYTADVFVSSEITGIKSVELSPNGPLDFHKGKILSTKPISEVYIAVTTFENDVYVYKYDAKTQIVSSYDMLK